MTRFGVVRGVWSRWDVPCRGLLVIFTRGTDNPSCACWNPSQESTFLMLNLSSRYDIQYRTLRRWPVLVFTSIAMIVICVTRCCSHGTVTSICSPMPTLMCAWLSNGRLMNWLWIAEKVNNRLQLTLGKHKWRWQLTFKILTNRFGKLRLIRLPVKNPGGLNR